MELKSIGVKNCLMDNFDNNYVLLTICDDKCFIRNYEELFGIKPQPFYYSHSGTYPTGKPMSYKILKTKLKMMIIKSRKNKLNSLSFLLNFRFSIFSNSILLNH